MKYADIKKESEKKLSTLFAECNVFFAFSNEQFKEGMLKNPIPEGEKYISIGAGGYMPKAKKDIFNKEFDNIIKWEKTEIKKQKQIKECIKYELYNHECFYTHDLTDVYNILPYEPQLILDVFNEELKKQK